MTTCSACGANTGPTSRFCTGCGRSVQPSSRAAATATATGTLTDELNRVGEQVNQTARQWSESGKEQVRSWGVRWSESAAIAGIGLSPLLVLGLAAGIALMIGGDTGVGSIMASIGLVTGLTFGGGIGMDVALQDDGELLSSTLFSFHPLGLLLLTLGVFGFALHRRIVRLDLSARATARQLTAPAALLYSAGVVVVCSFPASVDYSEGGFTVIPVTDRIAAFLWSLTGASVTAAVVAAWTGRSSERLGSILSALKAPALAIGALWAVLSLLLGGAAMFSVITNDGDADVVLLSLVIVLLFLPNLGLFALSGGTLGSAHLDAPYYVMDLLRDADIQTSFSVLGFASDVPALLWIIVGITVLGIGSASVMFWLDPSPKRVSRNIASFVGAAMVLALFGVLTIGIEASSSTTGAAYEAFADLYYSLPIRPMSFDEWLADQSIGLGFSTLMAPVTGLFAAGWGIAAWWIRPLLTQTTSVRAS